MRSFRRWTLAALPLLFAFACSESYRDTTESLDAGADAGLDASEAPDAKPAPLLELTTSPSEVTLTEAAPVKVTVTLKRSDKLTDAVQVTIAGLPAGVTVSPAIALVGATSTTTELTLTRGAEAIPADVDLVVHAAGGLADVSIPLKTHLPATPGSVDLTYAKDGKVEGDTATDFVIAPDGSVYIARNGGISRLGPDGKPDLKYAGAIAPLSPTALALAPSGDLFVLGQLSNDVGVIRLDASGAPVVLYGDAGVASLARPPSDAGKTLYLQARDFAVAPNLSTVVVGSVGGDFPTELAFVRKISPTGAENVGFVPPPLVLDAGPSPFPGNIVRNVANIVATNADGRSFVVATDINLGSSYLTGVDTPASADASAEAGVFGTVPIASSYAQLVPTGQGGVYTFSNYSSAIEIRRFLGNGTLDPTFGTAGVVTNAVSNLGGVAGTIARDGLIYVAGSWQSNDGKEQEIRIYRYSASGAADRDFGEAGELRLPLKAQASEVRIAVTKDAKLLLASRLNGSFFATRLWL